jgi:ribose transport system substrate-binding protein
MTSTGNRLVLLAALLALAGCGSTPSEPGRPRVALVMKSLANEFFKTMEDGARAHQAAAPERYELIASGIRDEQDVGGQIRLVEQMIAEGVDALVIAPADSRALVSACRRAQQAGLVVVNIDNRLDAEVLAEQGIRIPFVGPDNARGARLVGQYLAQRLEPGARVAILEGVPNAFNAVERKRGFEEAMAAAGVEVVASQSANWETSRANQVAAALVGEHPDLEALLCSNDSMALGAVAALKAAGREGEVLVVGYDNIGAVRQLLREGRVLATADQHAGRLAVYGIEHALEMLETGSSPEDRETPVELVTAETLEP